MAAGIRLFAVTDHDTVAALPAAAAAASRWGLAWIPGIEITAIEAERDVHVLGYGFDAAAPALERFLVGQRQSRVARLREFGRRFADLGMPIDVAPLVARAEAPGDRSVGRLHVASLLIEAGFVADVEEAFTRWLLPGRPGFVRRQGAPVEEVVAAITAAGGIASLAHPRLLGNDDLVARLLPTGLLALEAYHSDHDARTTWHYLDWCEREGLAVTGGSDHHGETSQRKRALGAVTLPVEVYARLRRRALDAGSWYPWPEPPAG